MKLWLVATLVTIAWSHYWPPAGGPNCAAFVGGACVSRMASGERWQDWTGRALACPADWPFGTRVLYAGQVWECMDRGGKIGYGSDGAAWLDFLQAQADHPHGERLQVWVWSPEAEVEVAWRDRIY